MKSFGKNLKQLRLNHGLYQADLSEIINVKQGMISRWENGINYPEVTKLIEIAEYFNVSIDKLLGLAELQIESANVNVPTRKNKINDSEEGNITSELKDLTAVELSAVSGFIAGLKQKRKK